jgi:hypothetical protein
VGRGKSGWRGGREEKVEREGECDTAAGPPCIFLSWSWCPTLPIGTLCVGRGLGAPTIFLGSYPRRQYFGAAGVSAFLAPSPNNTLAAFWSISTGEPKTLAGTMHVSYFLGSPAPTPSLLGGLSHTSGPRFPSQVGK